MDKRLKASDIESISSTYGLEPALVRALVQVESRGRGFLPDGRLVILFEGHVFWRQLLIRSINPLQHQKGNEDVLYPYLDRKKYLGGAAEWTRLEKAMRIHREAAMCSASYGLFQIMGFNHQNCGYATVQAMVTDFEKSESNQLLGAITFLKNTKLLDVLAAKNWREFARRYNGPGYEKNNYHTKLEQAYKKFRE
ncbi:MAG: N-acetylmuramidase family protein [Thermaurantimonas sp.]|uniref:N-acetylmuramidase family protein n=1 Tax=Thermaurantimonas TaxID=2681566 RepID=UPI0023F0DEB1|nr:N-acetylmuramidase family protein [Thermaurantimonas aggregans]MCX8149220.1 N-acetylmuramidase family protein [Thermaurantimonas aggregans]